MTDQGVEVGTCDCGEVGYNVVDPITDKVIFICKDCYMKRLTDASRKKD